jgi:hypothetical protein
MKGIWVWKIIVAFAETCFFDLNHLIDDNDKMNLFAWAEQQQQKKENETF